MNYLNSNLSNKTDMTIEEFLQINNVKIIEAEDSKLLRKLQKDDLKII